MSTTETITITDFATAVGLFYHHCQVLRTQLDPQDPSRVVFIVRDDKKTREVLELIKRDELLVRIAPLIAAERIVRGWINKAKKAGSG